MERDRGLLISRRRGKGEEEEERGIWNCGRGESWRRRIRLLTGREKKGGNREEGRCRDGDN